MGEIANTEKENSKYLEILIEKEAKNIFHKALIVFMIKYSGD